MAGYRVIESDTNYGPGGLVERVKIARTGDPVHPSGWDYSLHFGARSPEAAAAFGLEADDDGTILRYDNAHERTKGHERHTAHEVERIEFPGMSELHAREREVNDLRPDGGR